MKKGLVHILLVGCLVMGGIPLQAQQFQIPNDFVVTQFGMEEGLPQSSVNDIIQTSDGYIWLATFGGLVRFDGQTFTTYNRFNTEGMISDRIIKLFEDHEGGIWLFSENQRPLIMRFKEGEISTYTFDVTTGTSIDLYHDREGRLWYSAFEKIFRFSGHGFEIVEPSFDQDLLSKALQDTSGIWLPGGDKIYKTLGDSVILADNDAVATYGNLINHIYEFPKNSGSYLYGTYGNGIIYIKENEIERFTTDNGLPSRFLLGLELFSDNRVFAELFNNIAYWDGTGFREFPKKYFPDDTQLKSVLVDNEGNYWIGTSAKGLFRLREKVITMIDKEQGLENEIMLSLANLRNGNMLFSTNCGGVFEWNGEQASHPEAHEYVQSSCNWSVFEDSKSRIWIGNRGLYLTESLNKPGKYFTEENGFTGVSVLALFEDSGENIWIGTERGVYKYDNSTFTHFSAKNGLYQNPVRAIFEDDKGTIWVGSAGLYKILNEQVEEIELLNTTDFELVEQPFVRAIYEDEDGILWVGTYGNGLFRISENSIVQLTINDGLFDNIISHIVEDETGNFWMGSNRGISRVLRKDLNRYIEGDLEELNVYSYGVKDGMNSSETNGGFQPNAIVDDDMNIYFPTVAGVAKVATRKISKNEIPPPVYVTNLRTPDGQVFFEETVSLPYDTPFLEIDFTAVSFTDPEKVHFRYKLENLNEDWIEVGNRRQALYSKIPPGNYVFKVIASNNDGVWNETGDSFNLTIVPPFWLTTWFYSLVVVVVIFGGVGVYYFRVQQLKKENEKQRRFSQQLIESQENERRRIASELHDGLGQQILVIKNRAEIAHQLKEDVTEVAEQLNQIKESAQLSISDVRKIAHNLRPVLLEKLGLREAIVSLFSEIQETSDIDWELEVDEIDHAIPQEKEINLFRVIQESSKNIEVHSGASSASINVSIKNDEIHAVIMDNGKGLDLKRIKESKGMGFNGMQERMKSLGGEMSVSPNTPSGTIVRFKIPFDKS